ncbi:MAG: dienelactone hydrolase family protein [Microbacterium sp.]
MPTGAASVPVTVRDADAGAWAMVALAHGAGSGREHPFLVGLAEALAPLGISTARFDFPYRAACRRLPGPAAHAVAAWAAVVTWARGEGVPLWAAGKSYGGRMASMAAAEGAIEPAGLVYLGYPLHPPGRPDRARVAHLTAVAQPQLFLSGTNDPFVQPVAQLEAAVASCRDAVLTWVDGAGHSFEVKGRRRAADEVGAGLAPLVAAFLRERR